MARHVGPGPLLLPALLLATASAGDVIFDPSQIVKLNIGALGSDKAAAFVFIDMNDDADNLADGRSGSTIPITTSPRGARAGAAATTGKATITMKGTTEESSSTETTTTASNSTSSSSSGRSTSGRSSSTARMAAQSGKVTGMKGPAITSKRLIQRRSTFTTAASTTPPSTGGLLANSISHTVTSDGTSHLGSEPTVTSTSSGVTMSLPDRTSLSSHSSAISTDFPSSALTEPTSESSTEHDHAAHVTTEHPHSVPLSTYVKSTYGAAEHANSPGLTSTTAQGQSKGHVPSSPKPTPQRSSFHHTGSVLAQSESMSNTRPTLSTALPIHKRPEIHTTSPRPNQHKMKTLWSLPPTAATFAHAPSTTEEHSTIASKSEIGSFTTAEDETLAASPGEELPTPEEISAGVIGEPSTVLHSTTDEPTKDAGTDSPFVRKNKASRCFISWSCGNNYRLEHMWDR